MFAIRSALAVSATALAMSGCGGGGGSVASGPVPPLAAPAAPVVPAALAPVPASQSGEFASFGSQVRIRYVASASRYYIMLQGKDWEALQPPSSDVRFTYGTGENAGNVYFTGGDKYQYTGLASLSDGVSRFTYGAATPAGAVPVSGSATYKAELSGGGGGYSITGNAQFDFDFGKGTLGGFIEPIGNDPAGWGPYPLGGKRELAQTVYSSGSSVFSGAFSDKGVIGGSFSGQFTGPQAQELMGKWQLPFDDYYYPGNTVVGNGVFVGKSGP